MYWFLFPSNTLWPLTLNPFCSDSPVPLTLPPSHRCSLSPDAMPTPWWACLRKLYLHRHRFMISTHGRHLLFFPLTCSLFLSDFQHAHVFVLSMCVHADAPPPPMTLRAEQGLSLGLSVQGVCLSVCWTRAGWFCSVLETESDELADGVVKYEGSKWNCLLTSRVSDKPVRSSPK